MEPARFIDADSSRSNAHHAILPRRHHAELGAACSKILQQTCPRRYLPVPALDDSRGQEEGNQSHSDVLLSSTD